MPKRTRVVHNADNDRNDFYCEYDEISLCPLCHHALVPQMLSGYFVSNTTEDRYTVYIFNFCTHCRKTFIAEYAAIKELRGNSFHLIAHRINDTYPTTAKGTKFSEAVSTLSPMFVTIYNQAETAEAGKLNELVGAGYRRALEFLIKDYLCHKYSDEKDAIKAELLGKAIQRIEDVRIKVLAERSAWLGNDATHYVWKHEDYDLDDLKRFINAMLRYIESELAFDDALTVPHVK